MWCGSAEYDVSMGGIQCVCVLMFSEWVVVGFILLEEEEPSERAMTTLTNCGFVPMALFCFYHVIVSGKRVDLIVDGLLALYRECEFVVSHVQRFRGGNGILQGIGRQSR